MTAIDYAALAQDALEMIEEFGAPVVFLAGPWTNAPATDVTGTAVQIEDDPETLARLGVAVANPLTLLVAGKDLPAGFRPQAPQRLRWSGDDLTIHATEPLAPKGVGDVVILWTVVCSV